MTLFINTLRININTLKEVISAAESTSDSQTLVKLGETIAMAKRCTSQNPAYIRSSCIAKRHSRKSFRTCIRNYSQFQLAQQFSNQLAIKDVEKATINKQLAQALADKELADKKAFQKDGRSTKGERKEPRRLRRHD
jgi:hypothetical protein